MEQVPDKKIKRYYKRLIHKFEDKLRKPFTPFNELETVCFYFYKHNPELFKERITEDSVDKAMIKTIAIRGSGLPLDELPNVVQEIIRNDYELHKYVAEIGTASKSDVSPNTARADEA